MTEGQKVENLMENKTDEDDIFLYYQLVCEGSQSPRRGCSILVPPLYWSTQIRNISVAVLKLEAYKYDWVYNE